MVEHKGYVIKRDEKFPQMSRITRPGSGSMPMVLTGTYVGLRDAIAAIDGYLRNRENVDGKKAGKSGS